MNANDQPTIQVALSSELGSFIRPPEVATEVRSCAAQRHVMKGLQPHVYNMNDFDMLTAVHAHRLSEPRNSDCVNF